MNKKNNVFFEFAFILSHPEISLRFEVVPHKS
jgi:hypothetical protein